MKKMELLVDSHHGQYIPMVFAQMYGVPENFENWEDVEEDIEFLKYEHSNEREDYWEVWSDLGDKAILKGGYTLYHNEDLWAAPEGFEWPEF